MYDKEVLGILGGVLAHFEVLQVIPEWKKIPAMKYFLKKVKVFNV